MHRRLAATPPPRHRLLCRRLINAPSTLPRERFSPLTQQRHSISRDAVFGSEDIDRGEARLLGDAIPEVNCKTDIAGPKRIPSTANGYLRAAILDDGRHCELACTVEPNRVVCAAV